MDPPEPQEDQLLLSLPVHYSESLLPSLHIHQFQLLTRPLTVPPSAANAGKLLSARYKPKSGRYEIHVPNDVRAEVWNADRGREFGAAREVEEREEALISGAGGDVKGKGKEGEREKDPGEMRLSETRLISERVPHSGDYVLGVVRDGKLHLHPISETHQFSPNLSYLDVLSKQSSRASRPRGGGDSDSDSDGPPPDPDDPTPTEPKKKDKKKAATSTAREVTVAARRMGEDENLGGLSGLRRELIAKGRKEREEPWVRMTWHDEESREASKVFEKLFSTRDVPLETPTRMDAMLKATLDP